MTVEITNIITLTKAWKNAKKLSEREHVFPYVQFNPTKFYIKNIKNKIKLDMLRCTIDRKQDLIFLRELIKLLPKRRPIHICDIVKAVRKNPEILKINSHIRFDEGYLISLQKDNIQLKTS